MKCERGGEEKRKFLGVADKRLAEELSWLLGDQDASMGRRVIITFPAWEELWNWICYNVPLTTVVLKSLVPSVQAI